MAKKKLPTLDQYLRDQRLAQGYSQKYVADSLGYSSAQFISNWERGLASPPLDALSKLTRLLSLSETLLIDIILSETRRNIELSLAVKPRRTRKKTS